MKKLLLVIPLILIIFSVSACGVETASQHDERLQEEAESASLEQESSKEVATETTVLNETTLSPSNDSVQTTTSSVPKINVTINIKSAELPDANETFSYAYSVIVDKGSTAFDATKKACELNGISIDFKQTSLSSFYIKAINGLYEKHAGYSGSGWIWSLNGSFASTLSSKYILNDGDVITWEYSLTIDPDEM